MNKVFKLVWNRRLRCWVVASELTKSRGKKSAVIAACAVMGTLLLPNAGHAFTPWNAQRQIAEWMNNTSPVNATFSSQLEGGEFVFDPVFDPAHHSQGTPLTSSSKKTATEPVTFPEKTNETSPSTEFTAFNRTETSNTTALVVDEKRPPISGRPIKTKAATADAPAPPAAGKSPAVKIQDILGELARVYTTSNEASGKGTLLDQNGPHAEDRLDKDDEKADEKHEKVDLNAEQPNDQFGDKSNEKPDEKPDEKSDEKSDEEPAEKPEQKPEESSGAESDDEPDEESKEHSTLHEEALDAPIDEAAVAPASSPGMASATAPENAVAVVAPQAGSYNSNAWAANTMFQMNLNDRLGSYFQGEGDPHRGSAWIRYSGSHSGLKDESGQLRTKGDRNTVMMGIDMLADSTNDRDQVTLGVMGGYGHYDGKTSSSLAGFGSKGKVEGYGFGLYGTYQQNADTEQGVYVDTWLLWNQFDNRVKGDDLPREKYKSKGMTASLEFGYNAKIAEHNNVKYVLQPHAQLTYQHVRSDNFTDSNGTRIEFLNGSRIQTTVGLRAAAHVPTGLTSVITPHIEANWLHSTKGYGVRMNNADARMDSGRNAGQLKLGVEGNINQRLSLNVEVFHNQGNAGYHETGGNLMAKYRY